MRKPFHVLLSVTERTFLTTLADEEGMSAAMVLRRLLRKEKHRREEAGRRERVGASK